MSFQNDDLFLVNRGGDSFKTEYVQLKQSINEDSGVHVDNNPPTNPNDGDLWFNSDDGRLYVWYVTETTGIVTDVSVRQGGSGYNSAGNDVSTNGGSGTGLTINYQAGVGGTLVNPTVNSGGHSYNVGDVVFVTGSGHANGSISITAVNTTPTGQWVDASPDNAADGIEEAPIDGKQYARQDGTWEEVVGGGGGTTINYNGASAWASFNGTAANGPQPIFNNLNVSSVTKTASGTYNVVFANPMGSANYSVTSNGYSYTQNRTANGFTIVYKTNGDGGAALQNVNPGDFAVHALNALPPRGGTGADAWVSCKADGTVESSFNIASVTKSATGKYDLVFTTPMPTAEYAITTAAGFGSSASVFVLSKTTTGCQIGVFSDITQAYLDMDFNAVVHASNAQLPDTITMQMWDDLVARVTALENN